MLMPGRAGARGGSRGSAGHRHDGRLRAAVVQPARLDVLQGALVPAAARAQDQHADAKVPACGHLRGGRLPRPRGGRGGG